VRLSAELPNESAMLLTSAIIATTSFSLLIAEPTPCFKGDANVSIILRSKEFVNCSGACVLQQLGTSKHIVLGLPHRCMECMHSPDCSVTAAGFSTGNDSM